jgi:hypothetical protein
MEVMTRRKEGAQGLKFEAEDVEGVAGAGADVVVVDVVAMAALAVESLVVDVGSEVGEAIATLSVGGFESIAKRR